jgi:peptide/nickel transport system permease protein
LLGYALRRLVGTVPVLFGVTLVVFAMTWLTPGDPVVALLGDSAQGITGQAREDLRRQLGLDRPWPAQYLDYVGGLVRGDLGTSVRSRRPVLREVLDRLPATAELALAGLAIAVALLMLVFSLDLGWLPASGRGTWRHLVLPAVTVGVSSAAFIARITRGAVLETLGQDYVRTARAKGVAERIVVVRHALRNALLPIVTVVGLQLGGLLGGAVLTESVFAWPGVGRMLVDAILARDLPLVQGSVLVVALLFILVNLAVDLSYAAINPKVRYG